MHLNSDWYDFLHDEFSKDYFITLQDFLVTQYKSKTVYPEYDDIFRAFNLIPLEKLKVVIIGQDPYHGFKQANGLAFSVYRGVKTPPSLKNIYKELHDDIGCKIVSHGDLTSWAEQGVLLINSILSVESGKPFSHKDKGWEQFTNKVIQKISSEFEHLVFILWGAPAQKNEHLIDNKRHCILKAPHPSPLSAYRGFFGSKPFSGSNEYLSTHSIERIDWCLSE